MSGTAIDHEQMANASRTVSYKSEMKRAHDAAARNETQYAVEILTRLCSELGWANESFVQSRQSRSYWVAQTLRIIDYMEANPASKESWALLRVMIQDLSKM